MGQPKAWLPVGPEYLLQRVVRIVAGVVDPVVVAAHPHQHLPSLTEDTEVVYDAVANAGPLAGLAAAFAHLADRCEAVFVVSCDHPLIRAPFIRRLIDLLGDGPAVMPSHKDHTYPLLAMYQLTTLPVLTEMLAQGQFRVHDFARRCGARIALTSDLDDVDRDLVSLRNVNDLQTYSHILEEL